MVGRRRDTNNEASKGMHKMSSSFDEFESGSEVDFDDDESFSPGHEATEDIKEPQRRNVKMEPSAGNAAYFGMLGIDARSKPGRNNQSDDEDDGFPKSGAPLTRRRRSSKQECFIEKLYKMATSTEHASVFGFSSDGTYIELRNPTGLSQILKGYFKHSNTSSFIRQLNNYGFKTMSSISTGKSIQCFIHPQFQRDAPDEISKITRKTARVLKKCKREIIRDLHAGEANCRKRVKELEQANSRLENEVGRLERENARLVQELAVRPDHVPSLTSNLSTSSLASQMDEEQLIVSGNTTPMLPRYLTSLISEGQYSGMLSASTAVQGMESNALRRSFGGYSASPSDGNSSHSSRQSSTGGSLISLESYYYEPLLESTSDYTEDSPMFLNSRLMTLAPPPSSANPLLENPRMDEFEEEFQRSVRSSATFSSHGLGLEDFSNSDEGQL